ncbi:MAG: DUF4388 domain-containing protein [Holophagaceae bacterium]|nr:DUF4388 domain-containing protein [Holophagaceae bacterium]
MREAPLPDIIQLVSQGGKSGCFHVHQEAAKARIYLRDGRIIHAVTPANEGFEALMDVALWLEGAYHFEEGPVEVPVTINKPNASILMELGRRMDEWRVISQKVPSLELYPASTLLPGEAPRGVNPREARLLGLCTGYYSVAELAELTEKPVVAVAKDLYGLVLAGHVALKGLRSGRPPKPEAPEKPLQDLVPVSVLLARPAEALPEVPEPAPEPAAALLPKPGPTALEDSQRLVKLINFTQRIAQASKQVLPEQHHELVNSLQAKATQQILSGEGPDAVKGLALAISRAAVEAGCDGNLVRSLNTQLKALFTTR